MYEERIQEVYAKLGEAYEANEFDEISNLYTEDAKILNEVAGILEGPKGVASFYSAAKEKLGMKSAKFETLKIDVVDELITEFGKYTGFADDESVLTVGHYMLTWKEIDGDLKVYRDVTF